jgi:ABC-2 type transport system ATP-binding protein
VTSYGKKENGVFEYIIESEVDYDIRRDLFALLARKGWPLMSLRSTELTLEDIFLRLTSSDAALASLQEVEKKEEE